MRFDIENVSLSQRKLYDIGDAPIYSPGYKRRKLYHEEAISIYRRGSKRRLDPENLLHSTRVRNIDHLVAPPLLICNFYQRIPIFKLFKPFQKTILFDESIKTLPIRPKDKGFALYGKDWALIRKFRVKVGGKNSFRMPVLLNQLLKQRPDRMKADRYDKQPIGNLILDKNVKYIPPSIGSIWPDLTLGPSLQLKKLPEKLNIKVLTCCPFPRKLRLPKSMQAVRILQIEGTFTAKKLPIMPKLKELIFNGTANEIIRINWAAIPKSAEITFRDCYELRRIKASPEGYTFPQITLEGWHPHLIGAPPAKKVTREAAKTHESKKFWIPKYTPPENRIEPNVNTLTNRYEDYY